MYLNYLCHTTSAKVVSDQPTENVLEMIAIQ